MADMSAYPMYIYRHLKPMIGKRILEVGVGYGTYTGQLLEHGSVLGTDIATECIEAVAQRFPTDKLITQHLDLTQRDSIAACEFFKPDSIFCVNVLEHIKEDVDALRWLREICVENATLGLLVPAHMFLFGRMDSEAGHFRRYTRRSLASVVNDAGWTIQKLFYINTMGAIGWWFHNRVRSASLTDGPVNKQMRAADQWLSRVGRISDPFMSKVFGLSVLAFATNKQA